MTAVVGDVSALEALDERARGIIETRRSRGFVRRRGWLVRRALLASDVVGLTLAFALAEAIAGEQSHSGGVLTRPEQLLLFVCSLPAWVVAAKLYRLYDRDEERTDHSTTDDFVGVFHLVTVGAFLLYVLSVETGWVRPPLGKLLVFWVVGIALVPLLRAGARAWCRRQIGYIQNTVIVGAGEVGQTVAQKLLKHPEYGINLVGFVDAEPREPVRGLDHLTILGDHEDLPRLVELLDVERVIVAFSNDGHERFLSSIRILNGLNVQVDLVPRFFELVGPTVDVHGVEGLPLVGLRPPNLARSSAMLKRSLDVAGAGLGLLVLSPLLAAVACTVKATSRGPVFFRQERMGTGNRTFRIAKFRTMIADAEQRKAGLAHLNKHARNGGDVRMFKIDRDPRVTRLGRILRRFSIDELPQLWNVLRGDMSLVGPRPLVLDEHAHVHDWAERRLDLRPGMTGVWQVLGRDEIPFEEMVRLDYLYVANWSLGRDLALLGRTLPAVLHGSGRRPMTV